MCQNMGGTASSLATRPMGACGSTTTTGCTVRYRYDRVGFPPERRYSEIRRSKSLERGYVSMGNCAHNLERIRRPPPVRRSHCSGAPTIALPGDPYCCRNKILQSTYQVFDTVSTFYTFVRWQRERYGDARGWR